MRIKSKPIHPRCRVQCGGGDADRVELTSTPETNGRDDMLDYKMPPSSASSIAVPSRDL